MQPVAALPEQAPEHLLIVDALLGIGLKGDVRPATAAPYNAAQSLPRRAWRWIYPPACAPIRAGAGCRPAGGSHPVFCCPQTGLIDRARPGARW